MRGIKKLASVKKLAKKVKVIANTDPKTPGYECLSVENGHAGTAKRGGTFAVYVGKDRERFEVPTTYLTHPLFKILLEKVQDEFGFDQQSGLVLPCSVATFHEVMQVVECSNGGFDFGVLVEEFV